MDSFDVVFGVFSLGVLVVTAAAMLGFEVFAMFAALLTAVSTVWLMIRDPLGVVESED